MTPDDLDKMVVRINRGTFEAAAKLHASGAEISALLHCSQPTLRKWCRLTYGKTTDKVLEDFRLEGNVTLRSHMWRLAQKNPAVAIFMAKNYLGMSDSPQPVDTGERQAELVSALRNATRTLTAANDKTLYEAIPDADYSENSDEDDAEGDE